MVVPTGYMEPLAGVGNRYSYCSSSVPSLSVKAMISGLASIVEASKVS
uniref:Uncharacterized protein n=1 Tax=Oryza glaberrima TaxID=4538 RepID=I1PCP8_ORYGL